MKSLVNWSPCHSCRQVHWLLFIYKTLIRKTPPSLCSTLVITLIKSSLEHLPPLVSPLFSFLLQTAGITCNNPQTLQLHSTFCLKDKTACYLIHYCNIIIIFHCYKTECVICLCSLFFLVRSFLQTVLN